jgi:hypothetical protein
MSFLELHNGSMLADEFAQPVGMPAARLRNLQPEPAESRYVLCDVSQSPRVCQIPALLGFQPGELGDIASTQRPGAGQQRQEARAMPAAVDPGVHAERSPTVCDFQRRVTLGLDVIIH